MNTEEEVVYALIKKNPFFAFWDKEEISTLCAHCTRRTYNLGEALWNTGGPGDAAFVLISGCVERTCLVRPDGHRMEQFSTPGALMSLSSLVHSWSHSSTGIALERTEVFELTRSVFEDLFAQKHDVTFHLVDAIAENLVFEMRDTNRRLHQVFGQPAETLRLLRRRIREDGAHDAFQE